MKVLWIWIRQGRYWMSNWSNTITTFHSIFDSSCSFSVILLIYCPWNQLLCMCCVGFKKAHWWVRILCLWILNFRKGDWFYTPIRAFSIWFKAKLLNFVEPLNYIMAPPLRTTWLQLYLVWLTGKFQSNSKIKRARSIKILYES